MIGIARNRIHEYHREQKKRAHPLNAEVLELIESEASDLQAATDQIEEALETCLGKLVAEDYSLVRTRYENAVGTGQAHVFFPLAPLERPERYAFQETSS